MDKKYAHRKHLGDSLLILGRSITLEFAEFVFIYTDVVITGRKMCIKSLLYVYSRISTIVRGRREQTTDQKVHNLFKNVQILTFGDYIWNHH